MGIPYLGGASLLTESMVGRYRFRAQLPNIYRIFTVFGVSLL